MLDGSGPELGGNQRPIMQSEHSRLRWRCGFGREVVGGKRDEEDEWSMGMIVLLSGLAH